MSKGRRHPAPDELSLWRQATRSVKPLDRPQPKEDSPAPKHTGQAKRPVPTPRQPAGTVPPLTPIDRRTISRLGRGGAAIDARIDLHGLTQAAAHHRLVRFLHAAQADGARIVLVITGKGRPVREADAAAAERGVLRRAVPLWLAAPEMRGLVIGFGEAGPAHGGAGALYVRLRRPRRGRS